MNEDKCVTLRFTRKISRPNGHILVGDTVRYLGMTLDTRLTFAGKTKTNFNKLQVLQNKILRMIGHASWFIRNDRLREDLVVPPLASYTIQLARDTIRRSSESDNTVIARLFELDLERPPSRSANFRVLAN